MLVVHDLEPSFVSWDSWKRFKTCLQVFLALYILEGVECMVTMYIWDFFFH